MERLERATSALLRSMLPVQRRFAQHFVEGVWTPNVAAAGPVYASLWEFDGTRLWTVVNRENRVVEGPLVRVVESDTVYIDLVQGTTIEPSPDRNGQVLAGVVEPRAVGAILETDRDSARGLGDLISQQRDLQNGDLAAPASDAADVHPPT